MSEGDRRSAKLHKQPEVDDDTESIPGLLCQNIQSIPTPTVVPASSSSETSPEDDSSSSSQPPATLSRKLTRTQAFEGTSPPPDSFLSRSDACSVPSISATSPPTPLQQVTILPLPNGNGSLTITQDTARAAGNAVTTKGTSHQAKEFLLAMHTVSNDSGRGTLDDGDMLSRDPSMDACGGMATGATSVSSSSSSSSAYTDSTGTDLIQFFKSTLRKSAKDKKTLLAVEKELLGFMNDPSAPSHKMNEMNPYDRMVAHRVSAYYGLDHNVDQSGKCIVVTRSAKTRIPELKLYEMGKKEEEMGGQPKRKILLKKPASLDEKQSWGANKDMFGANRAKSLEERQLIYSEVRSRIFKGDEVSNIGGDGQLQNSSIPSSHLLHLHHHHPPLMSQQRSLDSMQDARQHQHHPPHASFTRPLWSSTDSSGYGMREHAHMLSESPSPSPSGRHQQLLTSAIPTSLSASPGGFSGHLPGDSQMPGPGGEGGGIISMPHPPQGFHYNRASPTAIPLSSSTAESVGPMFESPPSHPSNQELSNTPTGSLSDQSPASRPSSETGHSPMNQPPPQYPMVAYIVSTDFSSIPPGSCIINPETMQPHVNPDGSMYHYDPSCPPPFMTTQNMMATSSSQSVPSTHMPSTNFIYQSDPVYDLTGRFAPATSLGPMEGVTATGPEHMAMGLPGQTVSLLQSPPGPTSNLIQLGNSQVLSGQPIRYIYTVPPGAQHLVPGATATTLDPNSQVTTVVPMPPTGTIPGFPASAGGYQVINPTYIQTSGTASGAMPPCYDLSTGFSFTPDGNPIPTPSSHNVIQTYTVAPYPSAALNQQQQQLQQHQQLQQQQLQQQQQQQQPPQQQMVPPHNQQQQVMSHHNQQQQQSVPHLHHQQQQQHTASPFNPSNLTSIPPNAAAAATSFFTGVPLTNTSNSPSPLSQSQHQQQLQQQQQQHQQPSQHHHSQQQPSTILYSIGGVPVSPLAFPSIPPNSTGVSTTLKSNPPTPLGILPQTSYQPSTPHNQPPPPPQHHQPIHQQPSILQQQQQQNHSQQQNQLQQQSSSLPSNGYHPVTFSQQAVTFIPNQALTSQQGSQLVTIPAGGSYPQLRGTIIPMPGSQGMVPTATGGPTHFQLIRPSGPIQGAFHQRLPGVPVYSPYQQQQGRPRGSNPNRSGKGGKRPGGGGDNGQASGYSQQQQQQKKQHPGPPQQQPQQQHAATSCSSPSSIFPSPLLPRTSSSRP